jgi:plasmid stabilization system protein ParE
MRASYHPLAVRDVRQILDHYETEAGSPLADRFFATLLAVIEKALENPRRFPPSGEILRRANLDGFPYHVLFEETMWGIKVLVVRHHRRHPGFGLKRR